MDKWHEIWGNREQNLEINTLQSLINADGFDSPTGELKIEQWLEYINHIKSIAKIHDTHSMYEVGCGAGAFLYPFISKNREIGGLDYSKQLVDIITKNINTGAFTCAEAITLDIETKFDIVLSNSAFHYFPSREYSLEVIRKMIHKANYKVLFLDVNDEGMKMTAEKIRKGSMGSEEYKKKYLGLEHQYYPKQLFYDIAKEFNCFCEIFPQNIKNYTSGEYRYNVIITK